MALMLLQILKITRQTLCKYVKQGKIKIKSKLSKNFFEYDDESVFALIGQKSNKNKKSIVSYARVSNQNQKQQLIEQNKRIYESCISRGLILEKQYFDIKSGMTSDRKDFQEIIRRVIKNEISMIIIENKDRLIRFGYETLEQIFKYFGCTILVLNDVLENKSYEQELTKDLISIIDYFTMKSYLHRRKLNKLRKELESNEND